MRGIRRFASSFGQPEEPVTPHVKRYLGINLLILVCAATIIEFMWWFLPSLFDLLGMNTDDRISLTSFLENILIFVPLIFLLFTVFLTYVSIKTDVGETFSFGFALLFDWMFIIIGPLIFFGNLFINHLLLGGLAFMASYYIITLTAETYEFKETYLIGIVLLLLALPIGLIQMFIYPFYTDIEKTAAIKKTWELSLFTYILYFIRFQLDSMIFSIIGIIAGVITINKANEELISEL